MVTTYKGLQGEIVQAPRLSSSYIYGLIFLLGGSRIGQAFLSANSEERVRDVQVNESWRRQGIATALMEELTREAKRQGIARLTVVTNEDNVPARGLYTKLGFSLIGTLVHPEIGPAVCYALDLR